MNGGYFALKYELVVGIDNDGLEVWVGRHQAQIALFFCGEVNLLHRQPSVDEGHHDIAIRNFLRTVCQADVTVEEAKANHRLSLDTHKVRSLRVMNEFLIQVQ